MKYILLSWVSLVTFSTASHLDLKFVKQPVYLIGSDSISEIRIVDVPFVTAAADPEWRFTAICQPCVPATDGSWKEPSDVNLASLYKINVSGSSVRETQDYEIVIDASKALIPSGYPFKIEQIMDAITTCVKLMYPAKPEDEGKVEIKVIPPEILPQKMLPSASDQPSN